LNPAIHQAPRTLLFVPAQRVAELLSKARSSGADAVIIDFEDGALQNLKAESREQVSLTLGGEPHGDVPILIRVSAAVGPDLEADVAAVAVHPIAGLVVPKCDSAADVQAAMAAWQAVSRRNVALLPLIESPAGLFAAADIALAHPSVVGVALGAEDLAAQTGMRRSPLGDELLVARTIVAWAAALIGGWAVDTPSLELKDMGVVRDDAAAAAKLGLSGKLAIHPRQIGAVHRGLRPRADDVTRARRIVEQAPRVADGAWSNAGQMVDRPVIEAAQRLLARASAYEEDQE
jgi:citrate lyase beta subunit